MSYIMGSFKIFGILLIPYFSTEFVICSCYKRKGIEATVGFAVGWVAFALLFTAMAYITGAASVDEVIRFGTSMINKEEISLIPFADGLDGLFGNMLNVLLFVPLGIMMPMLWKSNESMRKTVMTGFIFSLVIEISQLFNLRTTDIDDLIMNTLGTAAGFLIWRFLFSGIKAFKIYDGGGGAAVSLAVMSTLWFFMGITLSNGVYGLSI